MLIWTTGAPVPRIRSASIRVSWSPSMTATGRAGASSGMVRRSSVVLPEPGELIRFSATMPRSASQRPVVPGQVVVLGEQRRLDLDDARDRLVLVRVLGVPVRGRAGRPAPRPGRRPRRTRRSRTCAASSAGPTSVPARPSTTEATASSRPASTSTSALPQGHSRIRSGSTNVGSAGPAAAAALRLLDLQRRALERRPGGDELEAEPHRVGHDARPAGRPAGARAPPARVPVRSVTASTTLWVIASSCIALPPSRRRNATPAGDPGQEVPSQVERPTGPRPAAPMPAGRCRRCCSNSPSGPGRASPTRCAGRG